MNRRLIWIAGTAFALMGVTAWLLLHRESVQRIGSPGVKVVPMSVLSAKGELIGTNGVALPAELPGYRSEGLDISQEVLGWLPPDTVYGSRKYESSDESVALKDRFRAVINVVLMGQDRTSIHKPEYCLTGAGWVIDEQKTTSIPIAGSPSYDLPVMRMLLSKTDERKDRPPQKWRGIYVFWFVADGQLTARHNQRMWWMARDLLTRGLLQRWAYVSCFTVCLPGREEEAYQRLSQLIAEAVPTFQLTTGQPGQLAQNPAPAE